MKNTDQALNIAGLYQAYGSAPIKNMHASLYWPHKIWRSVPTETLAYEDLAALLEAHPKFSYATALTDEQQQIEQQINPLQIRELDLMELSGHSVRQAGLQNPLAEVNLKKVPANNLSEIARFVKTCEHGFGYQMDIEAIISAAQSAQVNLYIAYHQHTAVGTVLTFAQGSIVGIYQLTISQALQGQGLGRKLMQSLLFLLAHTNANKIILQSSKSGAPLYASFGFKTTGKLKSYSIPT